MNLGRRLGGWRLTAMLLLLGACFLLGGASRLDVLSLVLLQPAAVICAGFFLIDARSIRWDAVRVPLVALLALALIMAVQLVPLPPELWVALPGHAVLVPSADVAGLPQPWRPISVTPDLTLASLVSLSVPIAVLIGFASLTVEQTHRLLPYVIIGIVFSAFIGLAQVAGGGRGPLYFYEVTNLGSPVGVFANRNHQAALLAAALPMLAVWAGSSGRSGPQWPLIAGAAGLAFLPLILVNGSRAGLVLGAIGLAAAAYFWRSEKARGQARGSMALLGVAAAVVGVAIIAAVLSVSRDESFQRLAQTNVTEEVRVSFLPTVLEITADFWPVGAGFGSFDPVFRAYEPLALLAPQYLNHAHNDLLELVFVGGLPAVVVLAGFLVWLAFAAVRIVKQRNGGAALRHARLGLVVIIILLLSSVVDYPLRTPLMAALFAVASGWVSGYLAASGTRSPKAERAKAFTGRHPVHRGAPIPGSDETEDVGT